MTLNTEPQFQNEITQEKVSGTKENNSFYKLQLISWKYEKAKSVGVWRRG